MAHQYLPKTEKQLKASYYSRVKKEKNGFDGFKDFLNWYNGKEKICSYCKITEEEIQEIVMKGLLTSNRFPNNGKIERGRGRGVWLEVDRPNPKEKYSRKNAVLCCYFCNNDKSDVFDGDNYLSFQKNRLEYLRGLLRQLK